MFAFNNNLDRLTSSELGQFKPTPPIRNLPPEKEVEIEVPNVPSEVLVSTLLPTYDGVVTLTDDVSDLIYFDLSASLSKDYPPSKEDCQAESQGEYLFPQEWTFESGIPRPILSKTEG